MLVRVAETYDYLLQPETKIHYYSSDKQSYKSFSSVGTTIEHCSAACYLEPPGQCHFYVRKQSKCYLGHISNLTYGANPSDHADYHFITGRDESGGDESPI